MKNPHRFPILLLILLLGGLGTQRGSAQSNTPSATAGMATNRPAPPRLDVRQGLRMELVADGSLVESPAAMAFDEHGRLFVAELRDYPAATSENIPSGRVRLLEDEDGDGVFDTSVVFADHLERPSGIECSRGGVFVTTPSELVFLLDQDGDGIADLQRTLLRFNVREESDDPAQFVRTLTRGPDQWIYVGLPSQDGSVMNVNAPGLPPLSLVGGGFSFDPLTLQQRTESGSGLTSHTFDDAGHRFVCAGSATLGVALLDGSATLRNPYAPRQAAIATLVPAAEGNRSLNGMVYRGNNYSPTLRGQIFLADPSANAIHLVKLEQDGLHPTAVSYNGTQLQPLVTSTGSSFRPMQLAVGPDDFLYVADLSRETYPAPETSSPNLSTSHGRIWRLVPSAQPFTADVSPKFREEDDLVSALASSNSWMRATAARLLVERQATNSVAALRKVLTFSKRPLQRMEALLALEAAGAATLRDLTRGMADAEPSVRAAAVTLSARRVTGGKMPAGLWTALRTRSTDPVAEVRLNTALALGSVQRPAPGVLLADLYVRDSVEIWMRRAMLTTRPESVALLFTELLREPSVRSSPEGRRLLRDLAGSMGLGGNFSEVSNCLGTLRELAVPVDLAFPIIIALAEGLDGRGVRLSDADDAGHWLTVANTAQGFAVEGTDVRLRSEAVRVMAACLGPDFVADEYLLLIFVPGLPVPMQIPVIEALARQGFDRDFEALTQRWHLWEAPEQRATLNVLLQSSDGTEALLTALSDGTIPIAGLTSVHMNLLREYPVDRIQARAKRMLGTGQPDRAGLVSDFAGALDLQGSTANGRELFDSRCSFCHRSGNPSFGPNLTEMRRLSPRRLLAGIIHPSQEKDFRHRTTVLTLSNGRMVWGVSSGEPGAVIELTTPEATRPFLGNATEMVVYPEWSLMPDNTSAGLTPQDVADLAGFIRKSGGDR